MFLQKTRQEWQKSVNQKIQRVREISMSDILSFSDKPKPMVKYTCKIQYPSGSGSCLQNN